MQYPLKPFSKQTISSGWRSTFFKCLTSCLHLQKKKKEEEKHSILLRKSTHVFAHRSRDNLNFAFENRVKAFKNGSTINVLKSRQ